MIENGKGDKYFLAFSSFMEMAKWRENANVPSIVVTFDDYAGILKKAKDDDSIAGFVIDPFGVNLVFTKEQALAIKEIKDKHDANVKKVKEGDEVFIGEPMEYPAALVEAIKTYLDGQVTVKKAYLQLMCRGEDESYVVVLDCENHNQKVFEDIAEVARPHLGAKPMDLVGIGTELGSKIAEKTKPFFEK